MKNLRWFYSGLWLLVFALSLTPTAHASSLEADIDQRAPQVESKVIAWRRDIHQNPELGNRETRTATLVADHLRSLGLNVQTGVAHTGVVGVLKGDKPGPVVAHPCKGDNVHIFKRLCLVFGKNAPERLERSINLGHCCSRKS